MFLGYSLVIHVTNWKRVIIHFHFRMGEGTLSIELLRLEQPYFLPQTERSVFGIDR